MTGSQTDSRGQSKQLISLVNLLPTHLRDTGIKTKNKVVVIVIFYFLPPFVHN